MAADRSRIVTLDASGTSTTVKDFNDLANYYTRRDTFQIRPGAAKAVMAERQRRYGGSGAVAETADNGSIAWTAVVKGATADAALARAEEIFATLRAPRRDLYFEWLQGGGTGATQRTFYEIRGPANLAVTYSSTMFNDAKAWLVDVEIPVAPLALAPPTTITIASTTLPASISLGTLIPGSAPSLANVTLRTSGGVSPPIWAMIGWVKQPGTTLASSVAPQGPIGASTASSSVTWSITADANYRGGGGLKTTTAGAGTASGLWALDPSVLDADDWALSDVDVEVWARVELASTLVSPKLTLSLQPFAGTAFGGEQFAAEFGSAGKQLTKPSSGTAFRFVKLGTLSMPVDKAQPLKWNLKVGATWGGSSAGTFGLDYLWLVPARQRALSPTAKPNDAAYPDFIASTSDTQKRICGADLSGQVASAAGNFGRDSGLGGSPIELSPGDTRLLLKLSSLVPDDPTSDATSEQLSHTGVTGTVVVWPRYWLAKGA
jgi:hypothetical protein